MKKATRSMVEPCDFSVSQSPFGLDFGTSDSGLTILLIVKCSIAETDLGGDISWTTVIADVPLQVQSATRTDQDSSSKKSDTLR